MNRYRTAPGLGPSKATATTTCQKCLKKGHYSYECKEGLQSRPYVSRASRTQQLRNPKLKPGLTETKLDDPSDSKGLYASDKPKASETRTRSLSAEPPAKRMRRSASVSSTSSVSTISTSASHSEPDRSARHQRSPVRQRSRQRLPSSDSRQRSLSVDRRRRSPIASRSRSPPKLSDQNRARRPRRLSRVRRPSDAHHSHQDDYPADRRGRDDASPGRQLSRKHDGQSDHRGVRTSFSGNNKSSRPRSLSPYSRRLALTQAMNVER